MTIGWPPIVLRLTAVAVLVSTLRPLPRSCNRNHLVLMCQEADSLDFKKMAAQILSFNLAVEFIILRSKKTLCNCRIADFMEKIKSTDIVLVTPSQCTWSKIKQCQKKVDILLPTTTTNGLVIQKNDSKRHWAVRYQMIQQWEGVKDIRSSSIRASVYYGINLDLKRFIAENTNKKTMKEITARVFQQIEDNSKFDKNGKIKQAIDAPMEAQLVKDDLELIRQLPDIDNLMNRNDRVLKEKNADFQTDEELQYTLDNELRDIKTFFPKKKPKKKSKSKRSESLHMGQAIPYETGHPMNRSNTSLDHLCRQNHNSCTNYQVLKRIMLPRSRRRSKKLKKTAKKTSRKPRVKPLYIFPYKFYIAGDFVALFDSFAVRTAISKDFTMKFKTIAMKASADLTAERKMQKSMEEAKKKFLMKQKLKADSASSTTTKAPVTTTTKSTEEEDEKEDEDRGNEEADDDDDFDDDWDDDDDEKRPVLGNNSGVALAGIVKKKKSRKKSSNSSAILKGKGEAKHLSFVSSSKNYDHRIKSFVVFFVAIIGVIIVISVLLIMAVRGKGTLLEGMYLGAKSSHQGPSAKTEKETNEREIFQTYGEMSDEEKLPLLNSMDSRWRTASGDLNSRSSQNTTMKDLPAEKKKVWFEPLDGMPSPELIKSEETLEKNEDLEHETTVQTTSAIERVRAFEAAREDFKRTAPLSSTQNIESLKRLHTKDNRPKITNITIPKNPFPKTQLGGRHVIIDFGKEKTSKGKEVQRIQDPNKSDETSRQNGQVDRSSNNAEDRMYYKGVRSWEGRQERSLVSFLDSIDSQNRGVLRYDHRVGSPWS